MRTISGALTLDQWESVWATCDNWHYFSTNVCFFVQTALVGLDMFQTRLRNFRIYFRIWFAFRLSNTTWYHSFLLAAWLIHWVLGPLSNILSSDEYLVMTGVVSRVSSLISCWSAGVKTNDNTDNANTDTNNIHTELLRSVLTHFISLVAGLVMVEILLVWWCEIMLLSIISIIPSI